MLANRTGESGPPSGRRAITGWTGLASCFVREHGSDGSGPVVSGGVRMGVRGLPEGIDVPPLGPFSNQLETVGRRRVTFVTRRTSGAAPHHPGNRRSKYRRSH